MTYEDIQKITSIILFKLSKLKYGLEIKKYVKKDILADIKHYDASKYWNARSVYYDSLYSGKRRLSFLRTRIIDDPKYSIKRVIEIGCGSGRNILFLAKRHKDIQFTGIDYSQGMLVKARAAAKNLKNVSFVEIDLRNVSPAIFEKQDMVLSISCLQHVDPFSLRKLLPMICKQNKFLYLQETHVRGYSDGKILDYPGFPTGFYYNHDYKTILKDVAKILYAKYSKGIICEIFCVGKNNV